MKKQVLCLTALVPFLLVLGCGEDDEGFEYQGYALESDDGGFAEGEDLPDFDDGELEDDPIDERDFDEDDADEAEAERTRPEGRTSYLVRLGWGQFPGNRELEQPTRWKGIVHGRGAKVFIVKTFAYERHDFVRPCRDRSCALIDSVTLPHHDGLLLRVVPVPGFEGEPGIALGFEGLFGRAITLSELDGLTEVAQVDRLGNRVVLDAMAVHPCPHGFMKGVWKRVDRKGGAFKGRWVNGRGETDGIMAGIWGLRRNGQRVFFGVYADPDGNHRGLLKGTYRPAPNAPGGVFVGRWINKAGTLGGVLRGHYSNPDDVVGRGGFRGKFRVACNADLPENGFCPSLGNQRDACLRSDAEVCPPDDAPVHCRCVTGPEGREVCICSDCYSRDTDGRDVSCLDDGTCDPDGREADRCNCEDDATDANKVNCSCTG